MPLLLPDDCLNEIFEILEEEKTTLYSCLLVSRLWCKISVRILWRNIWIYTVTRNRRLKVALAILSTLISCLPNESKKLLHTISTPISKPPLFSYASFCKVLSVGNICQIIDEVLGYDDISVTLLDLENSEDNKCLVAKEILKMFMNQISSLKRLDYDTHTRFSGWQYRRLRDYHHRIINDTSFTYFPGAKGCLKDLSELRCSSNIHLGQLSQICHNLQSLTIDIESEVSSGLKELISSPNNLKNLKLSVAHKYDWADIIPTLTKHSNTLTKLQLYWDDNLSLSFVSLFLNLQEIKFSSDMIISSESFKELQYATFPKLQILKIPYGHPKAEHMMKFLEINGKNFQEFYICNNFDSALNSSIAKFCPNLKKLFTIFNYNELDILKTIFDSCQYLEGIVTWFEKGLLDIVAKHSPKNFHELKLHEPKLFPEDLESFFISWGNRISKKSISLIFINNSNSLDLEENMKIIEKYKNLGIVKKFESSVSYFDEEEIYL